MIVTCPECNEQVSADDPAQWLDTIGQGDDSVFIPAECTSCNLEFWTQVPLSTHTIAEVPEERERFGIPGPNQPVPEQIPPLEHGVLVVIDNRGHRFHGREGKIVAKKHAHYRVSLRIPHEQGFRDILLWVPAHWVKEKHV